MKQATKKSARVFRPERFMNVFLKRHSHYTKKESENKEMKQDLLTVLEELFSFRSFIIASSVLAITSTLFAWGMSTL